MFISRPINYIVNFGSPANTEEGDWGGGGNLLYRQSKIQFPIMTKSEPQKRKFVWTKFIVLKTVIIKHSLTKSNHLNDFKVMVTIPKNIRGGCLKGLSGKPQTI